MMSLTSSMPIDRRTVSGAAPAAVFCSSVNWLWVVDAGWMAKERVSPIWATWLSSLRAGDEFYTGVIAALEAECEDGSRTLRQILLLRCFMRAGLKTCIGNPAHLVIALKPFGDSESIFAVAFPCAGAGFRHGQNLERVEWRQGRAQIAQAKSTAGDSEGHRAEGFIEIEAVIFSAWCIDHRELVRLGPIEVPASTITPPMELPWPPMNLVMECSTMLAPYSIGRQR